MTITTAQIRGARGILNWSQQDLAAKTGISATSIGSIEGGSSTPRASTLETIRTVFEKNGIEFIGMDGVRIHSSYIETYHGTEGFKDFMDSLYEAAQKDGGDFVLFNAYPPHWHKWLGEEWFNMHAKRMRDLGNKIKFRITAKEGTDLFISKDFAEYRWFPEELFNDRALYAYGNNLAFVNFQKQNVSVIVLKQAEFAETFRVLFDIAWEDTAIIPQLLTVKQKNKAFGV